MQKLGNVINNVMLSWQPYGITTVLSTTLWNNYSIVHYSMG